MLHATANDDADVDAAADALLVASRALVGVAARSIAAAADVTLPQFRALVVLSGTRSLTVTGLAEVLGVHQSTATRLCDRLVGKDLIHRRAGRTDRREMELRLAPAGRRLVHRVTAARRKHLRAIAASMTVNERRQAVAGLRAFAAAAGESMTSSDNGWAGP